MARAAEEPRAAPGRGCRFSPLSLPRWPQATPRRPPVGAAHRKRPGTIKKRANPTPRPAKQNVTRGSRVIPQRSTNRAQPSLTSVIGREPVHSGWYERSMAMRRFRWYIYEAGATGGATVATARPLAAPPPAGRPAGRPAVAPGGRWRLSASLAPRCRRHSPRQHPLFPALSHTFHRCIPTKSTTIPSRHPALERGLQHGERDEDRLFRADRAAALPRACVDPRIKEGRRARVGGFKAGGPAEDD